MGSSNSKDLLLEYFRGDRENEIRNLLKKNPELVADYVNKNNDYTALCMASVLGSLVGVKILVEVKRKLL